MFGEPDALGSVVAAVGLLATSPRGPAFDVGGEVGPGDEAVTASDTASEVRADEGAGVPVPHAAAIRPAKSNSPNMPRIHQVSHPRSHVAGRADDGSARDRQPSAEAIPPDTIWTRIPIDEVGLLNGCEHDQR